MNCPRFGHDIEHVHARVGDGLAVEGARLGSDGFAEILGVVRLHELHVDTEAPEADVELGVSAAVKGAGGDHFLALSHQAADGEELRRLAARRGQAGYAAFERRHPLFENIGSGVHNAGVDVAEFLQRKQIGGVVGIVENERTGLVDGDRTGVAGGVGRVAGVKAAGGKTHLSIRLVGHKLPAYKKCDSLRVRICS